MLVCLEERSALQGMIAVPWSQVAATAAAVDDADGDVVACFLKRVASSSLIALYIYEVH